MSQSLSAVNLHIIFSTKDRMPIIGDDYRKNLHSYMSQIIRDKGVQCYRIGGTADHVHVVCNLPRTFTQSDLVRVLKTESSKWVRSECEPLFGWQNGYGCFSVSNSHLSKLLTYVDSQIEHHQTKTFQAEYLEFLRRYEVEYDLRYVWD